MGNTFNKKNTFFWIASIGVFLLLILPSLIQKGMFMDGVLYASVAQNFADGFSTFWFPKFAEAAHKSFHEQPPLMFGLLGYFYKIFGNSIYVERLYSFVMAALTAFVISKTWKLIYKESDIKKIAWLPILLWIIIPVCFWSYINNMEENTMGLFALSSVYFIVRAIILNQKVFLNLMIAGIFIFLSSLTKGIQGSFPLIVVFLYFVTHKSFSFKKTVFYSSVLILVPIIIYLLLIFFNEDAFISLKTYLTNRVLNSIENVSTDYGRFYLIRKLLQELIPVFAFTALIYIIMRIKRIEARFSGKDRADVIWFILIGLSASLPLMITLEQRGFYLVTSLPYFALSFSIVNAKGISSLIEQISENSIGFRIFKYVSILILVLAIVLTTFNYGKTKRHEAILNDIYKIGSVLPAGEIISSNSKLYNEWALHCNLQRLYHLSLDGDKKKTNSYFLKEKNDTTKLTDYKLIPIDLELYSLYKK